MSKGARNRQHRHGQRSPGPARLDDVAPTIARRITHANEVRVLVTEAFIHTAPDCLRALESVAALLTLAEKHPAPNAPAPYAALVVRARSDFDAAFDGILQMRSAAVLDPCRDLMEISVLVRDFTKEPQRVTAWMKASEEIRGRQFGFRKLLTKHPEPMFFTGADQTQNQQEYSEHSRTLHPAMWVADERELSRDTETSNPAIWVRLMGTELIRHAGDAALHLLQWHSPTNTSEAPDAGDRITSFLDDIFAWLDSHYAFLDTMINIDDLEVFQQKYANRPARPAAKN